MDEENLTPDMCSARTSPKLRRDARHQRQNIQKVQMMHRFITVRLVPLGIVAPVSVPNCRDPWP
jgi:hypothetical protein